MHSAMPWHALCIRAHVWQMMAVRHHGNELLFLWFQTVSVLLHCIHSFHPYVKMQPLLTKAPALAQETMWLCTRLIAWAWPEEGESGKVVGWWTEQRKLCMSSCPGVLGAAVGCGGHLAWSDWGMEQSCCTLSHLAGSCVSCTEWLH